MDVEYLLGSVLREVFAGRGRRKRASGAMRYVLGHPKVAGMGAMALGGLAMQLFESLQKGQAIGSSGPAIGTSGPMPASSLPGQPASRPVWTGTTLPTVPSGGAPGTVIPPPLPTGPGFSGAVPTTVPPVTDPGVPADVMRVIRLGISAARADGSFTPQEQEAVLAQARRVGAEAAISEDLQQPRPIAEILAGVEGPLQKQQLYTIAFAIVRGDEQISAEERLYLDEVARHLGLDREIVAQLERDASEQITAGANDA